ncbi:hypothetical protein ACOMHN_006414 [Nucella lapillus]
MFHTSHIHVPRNRRPSALRTFIASSSFGPPDTKEPLRRGILLTAVAFVLLLIGSILTWLGFNDVFGGNMSMTGPLLIALSLLLLLLSFRQFLLARKRNTTNSRSSMQLDSVNRDSMTAVVVNRDDGLHPSTIIVDRYNRIGYDGGITVHRHWEDDCAPPSYQEVTRFSGRSNNTPCVAPHDDQDELPPTYEETMCSSIYLPPPPPPPPPALITSPLPPLTPTPTPVLRSERSSEEGSGSGLGRERDATQNNAAMPAPRGGGGGGGGEGVYSAHFARKPPSSSSSPVNSTDLELEMGRRRRGVVGVGGGGGGGPDGVVRNQSVSGVVGTPPFLPPSPPPSSTTPTPTPTPISTSTSISTSTTTSTSTASPSLTPSTCRPQPPPASSPPLPRLTLSLPPPPRVR